MKQVFISICFFSSLYTSMAQDWAELNRYKQANLQLGPPKNNDTRVVFMGNSITEGWVQESLSLFKNKNYINRGIGGQTTVQMKARFKQDVVELKPKVVVILAGINDIAQNKGYISIPDIAKNIEEMVRLAKANNIGVVVCSVLPANYFLWRPHILPADMVLELNQLLKLIAEKYNESYLDYYSEMVDDKKGLKNEFTTDGVHCTIEGYKFMEPIIENCLRSLF